jgi:hypothetical protein
MSHKPDAEQTPQQEPTSPETPRVSRPFLLTTDSTQKPIKVELVDHPVALEEPQFEALVADSQCEV